MCRRSVTERTENNAVKSGKLKKKSEAAEWMVKCKGVMKSFNGAGTRKT